MPLNPEESLTVFCQDARGLFITDPLEDRHAAHYVFYVFGSVWTAAQRLGRHVRRIRLRQQKFYRDLSDYLGCLFIEASDFGPTTLFRLDGIPPHPIRRLDIGKELVPDLQGRLGGQNES